MRYRHFLYDHPYVDQTKTRFRARFNNDQSTHMSYRRKPKLSKQRFHEHYAQHSHNGIDDWQCETHEQLKEENILATQA